ncbi:MAG TPA: hypothetical protein VNC78_06910 [Actinomycetota bacterium]|nr:hypothetical protein [Actinomycetota bacterium]
MKRSLATVICTLMVLTCVASPALAAKKKKPAAKPVATTLYMHGNYPAGEVDGVDWLANSVPPMSMDTTPGSEPFPRSMTIFNPLLNDQCSGIPLAFPTWVGNITGTIVGDAKITAHFLSAPGTITARIWVDTPVMSCNDAYIPPASEVDFALPSGQGSVEIVFPNLKLTAQANVMIEILSYSGTGYKGQVGRVLYDSASAETKLEFSCIPASGTSCAP